MAQKNKQNWNKYWCYRTKTSMEQNFHIFYSKWSLQFVHFLKFFLFLFFISGNGFCLKRRHLSLFKLAFWGFWHIQISIETSTKFTHAHNQILIGNSYSKKVCIPYIKMSNFRNQNIWSTHTLLHWWYNWNVTQAWNIAHPVWF